MGTRTQYISTGLSLPKKLEEILRHFYTVLIPWHTSLISSNDNLHQKYWGVVRGRRLMKRRITEKRTGWQLRERENSERMLWCHHEKVRNFVKQGQGFCFPFISLAFSFWEFTVFSTVVWYLQTVFWQSRTILGITHLPPDHHTQDFFHSNIHDSFSFFLVVYTMKLNSYAWLSGYPQPT